MIKKITILLLLVLICSISVHAQNTNVTATITDAGAQAWANGTYQFNFVPSPTFNGVYKQNGSPFTPPVISGNLDGTGTFTSIPVSDNNQITPSGTKWTVTVCGQTKFICFTSNAITITGVSQNITANVIPPTITVTCSPAGNNYTVAYSDSEVGCGIGGQYYNLTTQTQRQCTAVTGTSCTTWIALGGGSTPSFGAITSGTNNTATMNVGTGASLQATGTGVLNATNGDISGAGPPGGSCTANQIYTNTSNGQFYTCTGGVWFLAGGGSIANPVAALPVGVDTGVANAYVITTTPSFTPVIGSSFVAQLSHANTSATTMNVNGFGVKNLEPATAPTTGHPFTGGEFNTTTQYLFAYDGVQWLGRNCFPGFACGSGNGADYTQAINIPPDGQINLTTRALDNADQSRNLLNFYCPTKNTGCSGGQNVHMGFDGDGVFTIGASGGAVVGSLINTTWEFFDAVGFAGNGQANQAYLVQIVPNPAQTSGFTFHVTNPDASNMFSIDAPSHITVGPNNCTNASPAVCGRSNSGAVAVAAGSATLVVNTTVVQAGSQIILTEDSSLGTKLSVTCNTTPTVQPLTVTARTAGTSFTFSNTAPAVNPRCVSYLILN